MEKEIVLITGTNSGIGLLTTLQLAENGYFVIATMRNLQNQEILLEKARQLQIDENIQVLPLDVTKEDDIVSVVNYIEKHYGKIDILINNAGYCLGGLNELTPIDEWRRQFETNFFGVVLLTQKVVPLMRRQKRGKIINVGSISGKIGFPGLGPYASSKHALEGFSESLRLELLPFQIMVSIIEAGSYNTNIWTKALEKKPTTIDRDYEQIIHAIYDRASHTAKTAEDPLEVSRTILKICQSKKPKLRYELGKGTKSTILLKSIIPWSIIEKIIVNKLYKR